MGDQLDVIRKPLEKSKSQIVALLAKTMDEQQGVYFENANKLYENVKKIYNVAKTDVSDAKALQVAVGSMSSEGLEVYKTLTLREKRFKKIAGMSHSAVPDPTGAAWKAFFKVAQKHEVGSKEFDKARWTYYEALRSYDKKLSHRISYHTAVTNVMIRQKKKHEMLSTYANSVNRSVGNFLSNHRKMAAVGGVVLQVDLQNELFALYQDTTAIGPAVL